MNSSIKEQLKNKNFNGMNITVVGLGISGMAAASFLIRHGANVFVSDNKSTSELEQNLEILHKKGNFAFEAGEHTANIYSDKDLIVISPGVPPDLSFFEMAKLKHIPIINEVEFASYFIDSNKIIGITGTNGKTTVANLLHRILKNAGKRSNLCGNVGNPLIDFVDKTSDYFVVELSSFQLETISEFKAHIGVILNLADDHIEYHKTFEKYAAAKEKLFSNMDAADFALINNDDEYLKNARIATKAEIVSYSTEQDRAHRFYLNEKNIMFDDKILIDTNELNLYGRHNMVNIIAALEISALLDVDIMSAADTVKSFKGLPHRLEHVANANGFEIINDSKSTNPHSLEAALQSFDRPLVLIAGGKDKGISFSGISSQGKRNVKYAVLFGEAKARMREELDFKSSSMAADLDEAVDRALAHTQKGDVLLFSPGCSSYDMFENYKERGRKFKEIVLKKLKHAIRDKRNFI